MLLAIHNDCIGLLKPQIPRPLTLTGVVGMCSQLISGCYLAAADDLNFYYYFFFILQTHVVEIYIEFQSKEQLQLEMLGCHIVQCVEHKWHK